MSEGPQLADFLGSWSVDRVIDDRYGGCVMHFAGRADFVPEGEGLSYVEQGQLTVPGQVPMQAERRYFWRAMPPHGIAVTFDDGRPFHVIPPGLHPEASHDCAPDAYSVSYDFSGWPGWSTIWTVRGPRKDYVMTNRYRRAGAE